MTYTVRIRTLPGSPMMAEYECPVHGRFEELVKRDADGNPPVRHSCPEEAFCEDCNDWDSCIQECPLVISAPSIKFWSRDPVALGRASKHDEKDPRALDTEPLATGKMTRAEWNKYQRGITHERRYQKKLKAGKISKRIQVDSKGIG